MSFFRFIFHFFGQTELSFSFQFPPKKENDFSIAFIFRPKTENSFLVSHYRAFTILCSDKNFVMISQTIQELWH